MGDARDQPLVCPSCGARYGSQERFCAACNVPLTYTAEAVADGPVSVAQQRARKVKPQLSEGELIRVAGAGNQAEAEFIQGLLLEEGVPSILRRRAGFDVPDFLAAGPRDILVPQSGAGTAREVLLEAELISPETPGSPVAPLRLLVWLLVALALGALIVWAASRLVS
jgi:hypothetical protein